VNQTSDLIIHAGDHCYNEGDDDERRADAYMQVRPSLITLLMRYAVWCIKRGIDAPMRIRRPSSRPLRTRRGCPSSGTTSSTRAPT
jgi:hypothetical protein